MLPAMAPEDTAAYLTHRLARSGSDRPVFDAAAMKVLHLHGAGVPRRINIMAEYCLVMGAAEGLRHMDGAFVADLLQEASTDGPLSHLGPPPAAAREKLLALRRQEARSPKSTMTVPMPPLEPVGLSEEPAPFRLSPAPVAVPDDVAPPPSPAIGDAAPPVTCLLYTSPSPRD